ncbi:MAG TPA: D-alanine--D-alanine ligase family protein [Lapillicoccus sp.]|uniref:D-alanine--D-alanine ligase family protein n=1 Tax=Lapillicoccus sp. TaxID=1909287 RepID=UPI002F926DCF
MSDQSDGSSRKTRVAIVFGGRSAEHAVSCSTAASVLAAIDRDTYDIVPIGIAPDGRWVLVADDPEPLRLAPGHVPEVSGTSDVLVPLGSAQRSLTVLDPGRPPRELGEVDVVFPLLHGPFGEDGTIQGLLELADVRYVGSGVTSSAVMMDKAFMKLVFSAAGLPIVDHVVVTDRQWRCERVEVEVAVAALGFPVFVKPARSGSSIGISRVASAGELAEAVEAARAHDPKVIVEAGVHGREIECAVLGGRDGGPPRPSRLGEAVVVEQSHAFYDFEAKYLAEDVSLVCPADVPDEVAAEMTDLAVRAFEAAGCEGLARVDFFYADDGRVILNEINTMPGFTPSSMYPYAWQHSGLSYPELIDELLQLALERPLGLR